MSGCPTAIIRSIWSSPSGLEHVVSKGDECSEKITDGLRIYHNPYASIPLPLEVFRKEGVAQIWADPVERSLFSEEAENCLQSRTAMMFFTGKDKDFVETPSP